MQAIRRHSENRPFRSRAARTMRVMLLLLFTLAIIMGGLVLYLGPDLWVLFNAWMQQGASSV